MFILDLSISNFVFYLTMQKMCFYLACGRIMSTAFVVSTIKLSKKRKIEYKFLMHFPNSVNYCIHVYTSICGFTTYKQKTIA